MPESAKSPPGAVIAASTGASSRSGPARIFAITSDAGAAAALVTAPAMEPARDVGRSACGSALRDDLHTVGYAVDPRVLDRRLPRLGVDVERGYPVGAEYRRRNREDA